MAVNHAHGSAGVDDGDTVDAVVVGAGFAGLYMVYRLRALGFTVPGFEAGARPLPHLTRPISLTP